MPSVGLRLACVVLATSCLPVRFTPPTLPVVPAAVAPPSLPSTEARERVVLPDDTRIAAPSARLGRDAVLALGPVPEAPSTAWEFLRRLLARATVPVLDLTGIDRMNAHVEPNSRGRSLTLDGPLLAATWAAQLGSATHLLVTESLAVADEPVRVERSEAPSPEVAARYREAVASAAARCRTVADQASRELTDLEAAWRQAEARYRDAQNFLTVPDRQSEMVARSAYEGAVASLTARRDECRALAAQGAGDPAARVSVASTVRPVARGSFRVVAVPGGVLVWSASFARAGETRDDAVRALLDAVLDALPAFAAAPVAEGEAAPPDRTRARRGHHRRRRGDPR